MKRLFLILILTFSFQSLSKADDIRDFEIEGISVGDSLLNLVNKSDIKKNKGTQTHADDDKNDVQIGSLATFCLSHN